MTLDYFYGQAGELFSFFRIPKALFQEQQFQDLSTDAKTLYGILLDRMSLSVKNEWFNKKGRVFIIFTIEDVKRTLRCADNKATRLLRELEEFGLIERKRRGQGKPCLVYVKNFSSESSKESVKNRDNDDSCGSKIACQDPVKSRGIKKKENKTEMNNTNPILSDESEKMKNRELLEEYFSCSLEIKGLTSSTLWVSGLGGRAVSAPPLHKADRQLVSAAWAAGLMPQASSVRAEVLIKLRLVIFIVSFLREILCVIIRSTAAQTIRDAAAGLPPGAFGERVFRCCRTVLL